MTIRTTSKIEAALLAGNGCRLLPDECEVDSNGIVVIVLDVPVNRHDMVTVVRDLCGPPVGRAMKDVTDLIYRKTGRSGGPR